MLFRSGASAWTVRIYYKPFIDWIWGGCVLMALGGVLAVLDRRYRTSRVRRMGADTAGAATTPTSPSTPSPALAPQPMQPQLANKAPAR